MTGKRWGMVKSFSGSHQGSAAGKKHPVLDNKDWLGKRRLKQIDQHWNRVTLM